MFQLLSTIALKFGICLYNVKKYAQQYIKNIKKKILKNFLIAAPAPESGNAPMLHSNPLDYTGVSQHSQFDKKDMNKFD